MSAFSFDTQRAALTIAAFVATFVIALAIGRFLKRRANVQLGIPYQLFCLTLAFYVGFFLHIGTGELLPRGFECPTWRRLFTTLAGVLLVVLLSRLLES